MGCLRRVPAGVPPVCSGGYCSVRGGRVEAYPSSIAGAGYGHMTWLVLLLGFLRGGFTQRASYTAPPCAAPLLALWPAPEPSKVQA